MAERCDADTHELTSLKQHIDLEPVENHCNAQSETKSESIARPILPPQSRPSFETLEPVSPDHILTLASRIASSSEAYLNQIGLPGITNNQCKTNFNLFSKMPDIYVDAMSLYFPNHLSIFSQLQNRITPIHADCLTSILSTIDSTIPLSQTQSSFCDTVSTEHDIEKLSTVSCSKLRINTLSQGSEICDELLTTESERNVNFSDANEDKVVRFLIGVPENHHEQISDSQASDKSLSSHCTWFLDSESPEWRRVLRSFRSIDDLRHHDSSSTEKLPLNSNCTVKIYIIWWVENEEQVTSGSATTSLQHQVSVLSSQHQFDETNHVALHQSLQEERSHDEKFEREMWGSSLPLSRMQIAHHSEDKDTVPIRSIDFVAKNWELDSDSTPAEQAECVVM